MTRLRLAVVATGVIVGSGVSLAVAVVVDAACGRGPMRERWTKHVA